MTETVYRVPGAPYMALLGDYHNSDPEPVISSLRKRTPSIICLAGDLVYARAPETGLLIEEQNNVLPLLKSCVEIAPTFMSLGNHESILCDEDISLLRKTGVTVLDNEWANWNGIHIGIGGRFEPRIPPPTGIRLFGMIPGKIKKSLTSAGSNRHCRQATRCCYVITRNISRWSRRESI